MLQIDHPLNSTCLCWAAKAGLPRESRRLLGRHADALQGSDSFYSRDLTIGPVRGLQTVIRWIRDGVFCPDNNRAEYFLCGHPTAAVSTPGPNFQPRTPAFFQQPGVLRLGSEVEPHVGGFLQSVTMVNHHYIHHEFRRI